ncbi:alpha/beta-hydrolase [Dendrothele bispora CBS 962.96]|uniref:Alpha/beta-hydrolase n=1 Tax=Dendrothele bispora (strain CBS 962.96) TaxID=1314807 RepID=A0A4S8MHK5_DENBC|nr:alpha/beta-hydrolase [Dendrothele bispora CBS 962.96]
MKNSALVLLPSLLIGILTAYASPIIPRQSIATLSTVQISSFKPFSFFAAAAYCDPDRTLKWNCGVNCRANPDFIPIASGGDGASVQLWFVGYSPSQDTVVVSHQGTDPTEIESVLTDSNFFLDGLDSSLFPGVPSSMKIHNGFGDEHAKTAKDVLAAVQKTLAAHGTSKVTLVGHSLGGALSLLESVYLPLHLPSGITFRSVLYGLPRIGNGAFADYVDSHVHDLTHISNEKDLVPTVPGRFLGFEHPSGEVHIDSGSTWNVCPGHDDEDARCTVGAVRNILQGNVLDHLGPYDGVNMGTCFF